MCQIFRTCYVFYLILPHAPHLKDGETEVSKRSNSPGSQKKLLILWVEQQSGCFTTSWLTLPVDFYKRQNTSAYWPVWSIYDSHLSKVAFSLYFRGSPSPSRWSILICFLVMWNIVELRWEVLVLFFLFSSVFIFLTNMKNVQRFRTMPRGILFLPMMFLLCPLLFFWKNWRPFAKAKHKKPVWVMNTNHWVSDIYWQANKPKNGVSLSNLVFWNLYDQIIVKHKSLLICDKLVQSW